MLKTIAMAGFYGYVAVLLGAGFTGLFGAHIELTRVFHLDLSGNDPVFAHTLLNQYRFFKGLELCLGLFFIAVRRDVITQRLYARFFTGVVFTGALGRILSVLIDGVPHIIFTILIFAEIAIGILFLLATRNQTQTHELTESSPGRR